MTNRINDKKAILLFSTCISGSSKTALNPALAGRKGTKKIIENCVEFENAVHLIRKRN